jgi:ubiquitin carboxyl-terminal hydrolase 8
MNGSNDNRSNLIKELVYIDLDEPISNGLKGLTNLGNTCYLNSIVQCLSQTIKLTDHLFLGQSTHCLLNNSKDSKIGLVISYIRLLSQVWYNNNTNVDPQYLENFVRSFIKHFPQGMHLRQNDAHETLLFILDTIHTLLSKKVTYKITGRVESEIDNYMIQSIKEWQEHYKNTHSYIIDLFGGQEQLKIQCVNCDRVTKRYPASLTTILNLNDNTDDLYDCLDHLTSVEQLEEENKWQCDHCKAYTRAYKKIGFWKLPEVFVITLNRFVFNGRHFVKNNKLISFPLNNLNMQSYIAIIHDHYIYDLYAVSCHTGQTKGGHYYSYCLNQSTNKWYCFNDNKVDEVTDIRDIICPEAYILFYKLKRN